MQSKTISIFGACGRLVMFPHPDELHEYAGKFSRHAAKFCSAVFVLNNISCHGSFYDQE